jgi:hypothetical protein
MTPAQVVLVQASFAKLWLIKQATAGLFHDRRFEIDPTTPPLFARPDMVLHGQTLMATPGFVWRD